MDEIAFKRRIVTSRAANLVFPMYVETVECAIDYVQELSIEKLRSPHWVQAKAALFESCNNPKDESFLEAADTAFRTALSKEGWLDDLKTVRKL